MNKRFEWLLQQVSLKVLILAALFVGSIFLFAYIAHEAMFEKEDTFDTSVHNYVAAHATPTLIQTAHDLTILGSSTFLFPAYVLIVGIFIIYKKKRYAIDIPIVAASSFLMMWGLKKVFQRSRPNLPIIKGITSYSFPSGHSLSSFIFCSILAYLVWKSSWSTIWKWIYTLLLALLAFCIGLSRIVLNVHFATDVIAGFCVGITWVTLSFWVIQKINHKRSMRHKPVEEQL